jgi:LAS superfamily LD-carboxypeptidase LdcB
MKESLKRKIPSPIGYIFLTIAIVLTGYIFYDHSLIKNENIILQNALENAENTISSITQKNSSLNTKLVQKQVEVDSLGNQVGEIASTVGTLKKLSETDKELLQKYSKVYFLNENYIPSSLGVIDKKYVYQLKDKDLELHSKVLPYLHRMLDVASSSGLKLEVISAYRSFGEQAGLKSAYKVTYGAGSANQFSADQGYSEHQLGTTIDFTTPKIGDTFSGFSKTPEYDWLIAHAHEYGFIISYPKDNGYYQFEPWHWRFVGIKLATMLHNEKKSFYDLDQRDIDKYLITIFDNF